LWITFVDEFSATPKVVNMKELSDADIIRKVGEGTILLAASTIISRREDVVYTGAVEVAVDTAMRLAREIEKRAQAGRPLFEAPGVQSA
jgi:hypothetical protein